MEENLKKKKRNNIIITSLGVIASIAIGGIGGYFIAIELSPKGFDYSKLNQNEYEDDVVSIYNNYLSNPLDPLSYSPNDLVNIALYKYSLETYTESDVNASAVSLGVTQKTFGKSIKNNKQFFNESISQSSFVKVAKRFYEDEDTVSIYNGEINNDNEGVSGNYKDKNDYTIDEYIDTWGKDLSRPVIYNISSKTTLDTSFINKTDNGYFVSLDLDPITSVIRYVKQMVQMSNLDTAPQFENVHIEFSLDDELNLIEMNVQESYYVWVVGKNFTEATLNEKFYILEETNIPEFNEKIYY